MNKSSIMVLFLILLAGPVWSRTIQLSAESNMVRLLNEFDRDSDKKITVLDKISPQQSFKLVPGITVSGVYHLANLLQELKLQTEDSNWPDSIEAEKIFENPVTRTSRLIKNHYWDSLTRRIDKAHLREVMPDPKLNQVKQNYLYVPKNDLEALRYFKSDPKLSVIEVPEKHSFDFLKSIQGKHGLLTLKLANVEGKMEGVPYVVPGGRFNEMYGWDSYFQILGLLQDDKLKLAQGLVDNLVYEINHYGKILNANRSYYLSRSQPPFLTSMIRAVYEKLPRNNETKEWLRSSLLTAIKEYTDVWMKGEHLTEMGLNRYYGEAAEIPPEVEPGHFDDVLIPFAKKYRLSLEKFKISFNEGKIIEPSLKEFFIHDQAVRESGHDTTYRWRSGGRDRCADFVTVDLNSLLYKTELDIAYLLKHEFQGIINNHRSADFSLKAARRKDLIRKYLWEKRKGFSDYNWKIKQRSYYLSATDLYPLWAHEPTEPETRLMDQKEMELMVKKILPQLEVAGGVVSTGLDSLRLVGGKMHERQWDYPYGWAPHQMLIWLGLRQNGYNNESERLIYKWLFMITKNVVDYNGTIPEKYDVVERSHAVFAEYGNVGTKFSYITREGFGWMNASYQLGLSLLPSAKIEKLKNLVPPESMP